MLPKADNSWTLFEAAHLLNRAGFGGSPDEIRALHALGREKAVDSLVAPTEAIDAFPLPAWSTDEQALADLRMRLEQRQEVQKAMKNLPPEEAEKVKRETQREYLRETKMRALEAQGWWFRRMLATKAPLREKMTLFWHDHFATSIQKVKQTILLVKQNELFRESAFGSFRELTQAILLDPAMMLYLDTQSSKKGKPNENFAREVMELFTLGEGNYTEGDIHEAARAFTGYQLDRSNGKVFHNKRQWDSGDKTVFGKTGAFTGEDVINLIFEKKETARFMSRKLWEFFVYEGPPPAAIDALADSFMKADFQTGPLLRDFPFEGILRGGVDPVGDQVPGAVSGGDAEATGGRRTAAGIPNCRRAAARAGFVHAAERGGVGLGQGVDQHEHAADALQPGGIPDERFRGNSGDAGERGQEKEVRRDEWLWRPGGPRVEGARL